MNLPAASFVPALLTGCLVLVLPGAAFKVWDRRPQDDFLEWLADSVGISLSLCALIAMGAFFLQVRFTAESLTVLFALAGILFLSGLVARLIRSRHVPGLSFWVTMILGLLGLGVLIAFRLYQARDLLLPAWVDSVHHVLIVEKILAVGGVPDTLAPDLPVLFSYHYAFHLTAALFSAVARLTPVQATLVIGQVISALISLSIYRLGKAIWGDPLRAGLAGLLAGFAFHMPAYYVTWGRYTLLTGLVVLPLAMAAVLDADRRNADGRGRMLALVQEALLTAGQALSHYTTLWLFALFLTVWGVLRVIDLLRPRPVVEGADRLGWAVRLREIPLVPLAAAVVMGIFLSGPWLARMLSALSSFVQVDVVSPTGPDQTGYLKYILVLLGPRRNRVLLILAGAALLYNLVRSRSRWLAIWGLLLGVLTLPWGFRFGPFRPDHYAIILFLPASLLLADGIVSLGDLLRWGIGRVAGEAPGKVLRVLRVALPALVVVAVGGGLLGWGIYETRSIVNPVTVLVKSADIQAIDWIQTHTPPEARFFINTTHWQENFYRGVDGGYWIETLSGRQTIQPNAMYGWGDQDYIETVSEQTRQASQVTACEDAFWSLVDELKLTYVYVREGVGSLQPRALNDCQGLLPVYRRDGVFIYEIVR